MIMTMTTTGILITDGCERHNDGVHESCHAHEVHLLGPEWNRRYSNDKGERHNLLSFILVKSTLLRYTAEMA